MSRTFRQLPVHFLIAFLFAAAFQFACSGNRPSGNKGKTAAVTFTDMIGRRVVLPAHPRRIISLAPSVTEVLYLLGCGERVIGVTTQCDWPPEEVAKKTRIGSLLTPNYELILASRPDLVIASTAGNDQTAILKLADLGLPVFVTAPRSIDGIIKTTLEIGKIADRAAEGEQLVREMDSRLDAIRGRLSGGPPVKAFFITWFDPLLAPGKKTFENDVLSLANVISISAESDEFYPRYSLEQVVAQNPDVILTVRHSGKPLPDLGSIAGWAMLDAVRKGRVYVLSEVLQHPSPRFVDGAEELARTLYPERFR
jgi:iron complex transport system substrate-binding protein